jgi:hypothetical protein
LLIYGYIFAIVSCPQVIQLRINVSHLITLLHIFQLSGLLFGPAVLASIIMRS